MRRCQKTFPVFDMSKNPPKKLSAKKVNNLNPECESDNVMFTWQLDTQIHPSHGKKEERKMLFFSMAVV